MPWATRESRRFETERLAIIPDVRRWDKVFEGIADQVENDPTGGKIRDSGVVSAVQQIEETDIWAITTGAFFEAPALVVYYRIQRHPVLIAYLSVILSDEENVE